MGEARTICHSDLNGFYASVEQLLNPSLRGKPVAVCGSTEERHGIVLAKSELAKRAGVKTGMVNHEARRLCPGLIMVPPHFDEYVEYSKLARQVYEEFSDNVEPFGMDECWLQVINHRGLERGGFEIAEEIRNAVKRELGLTVSVGASFNKVFAKLGSDMKKPDATTVISREDFKSKVWILPVSALLFVGRATTRKLGLYGIRTIGELARSDVSFLRRILGVNGETIWRYANGEDEARVMRKDYSFPVKSVGHGVTCREDLVTEEEVWLVILELCQDVGRRLRINELAAGGVQLSVKDSGLAVSQYQAPLPAPAQSPMTIAQAARELFRRRYGWNRSVRAVSVTAINLRPKDMPWQLDMFTDAEKLEKREKLAEAVDGLRERFGKNVVLPGSLSLNQKLPSLRAPDNMLPAMMFQ